MATSERATYFYSVEGTDAGRWRRDEVLRALDTLQRDPADRFLDVEGGDVVFVAVDRVPTGVGQTGRLRLLRSRRSNLPAMERAGALSALPLPADAGLAEPSHVVFAPDGLVAAEFNFFAPRMTALARYIRTRLNLNIDFATFMQRDILERLNRLEDVRLLELSLRPSPMFAEAIRGDDAISQAVYAASVVPGERRVSLSFSGHPDSAEFTAQARGFAGRAAATPDVDGDDEGGKATVLRVRGHDPASDSVEWVDLLKEKVVRRVRIEREDDRTRALDTSSAYHAIEAALDEAREHDLVDAGTLE
jgi:hypothetical protein